MAEIYISGIHEFKTLKGMELVTNVRRERILRYLRSEDKARCLLAGLLLRRICGITEDRELIYGKNGKPYLKNRGAYFNLSHSGDYAVLAIADSEVGVDIEKVIPYPDALKAPCFTAQEKKWLQQEGCRVGYDEAFYRLWTAKESVMKASGLGFSLPPETFSVSPVDSSAHISGKPWFLNWLSYDGHIICHAIENKIEKIGLIKINPNDLS